MASYAANSFYGGGSSSAGGVGGWNFIADSDNQLALSDALMKAADNFDAKKTEMYGKIDDMGTYWKGEDYDLFNSSAHNYDGALKDFSDSIRMYSDQFESISHATEQLATELIGIITNMTGTANSTGTSGVTGGTSGITGGVTGGTGNVTGGTGNVTGGTGNATGGTGNVTGGTGSVTGGTGNVTGGTGNVTGGTGSNAISDPNAVAEGTEEQQRNWYQKIGDRYVDDWNNFTGDVKSTWDNVDGLLSGSYACCRTLTEFSMMTQDMALNSIQAVTSASKASQNWLFDAGNTRSVNGNYWDHIGEDFAENWDFSTADNFGEGLGVALTGTFRTAVDVHQAAINLGIDAFNGVIDGASWISDKIGDGLGWLGGKIFG